MVPLPLVLLWRDTWGTPGKTLAWWYESSSDDMISVSRLVKKPHGIIPYLESTTQPPELRCSTVSVLRTDQLQHVFRRIVYQLGCPEAFMLALPTILTQYSIFTVKQTDPKDSPYFSFCNNTRRLVLHTHPL